MGIAEDTPDREIVKILWDAMDVRELAQSIAASGYFPHEPLIAVEEDGNYVVIEGNRRLAAVRLLLDDELADEVNCRVRIKDIDKREALRRLPVIVSDRKLSWRYLGFKHVNGPANWSSYAKAQYIAEVHRSYGIPLAGIAEQIGDGHRVVQRLYRGLMVIDQAEREKVFHRSDSYRKNFAFSHLYTGIDYDGIGTFLSLESAKAETSRPVPGKAVKNLGELCFWLYGSRKQEQSPVVRS